MELIVQIALWAIAIATGIAMGIGIWAELWLGSRKKRSANSKSMPPNPFGLVSLNDKQTILGVKSFPSYLPYLPSPNSFLPVSSSMVTRIPPGQTRIIGSMSITNPGTRYDMVVTHIGDTLSWTYEDPPGPRLKLPEHITHPVLGYRAFYIRLSGRRWDVMGRLVAQDVRLCAINMQFGDWQPGVNQATHYGEVDYKMALPAWKNDPDAKHVAPESGCMCGFWSLHQIEQAIGKVGWPSHDDFTHIPVVGLIQGWGRVQEHQDGYRFQYASLISLSVIDPASHVTGVAFDFAEDTARGICRMFDVPYTNRWQDLVSLKDAEEAKLRA